MGSCTQDRNNVKCSGGAGNSNSVTTGGYSNITKHWPNHVNVELLKSTICQSSDREVKARVQELQERYVNLNCAVRAAKAARNELTRACTDSRTEYELLEEEVRRQGSWVSEKQSKIDEQNQMASQYDCEVQLLQNQPPPRLPPNVTEDLQMGADLEKLGDRIFEMYGGLLVLRAGEVVLFEDMKRMLEKRPLATRQVKVGRMAWCVDCARNPSFDCLIA